MRQEAYIVERLSTYLKSNYPNLIYRFDVGADIRLKMGQAKRAKRIYKHERGYPDLFIALPSKNSHGLFIEIKTDKSKVFKKNGEPRQDQHNKEQREYHKRLRVIGYTVLYGFGLEDTKNKIDNYIKRGLKIDENKEHFKGNDYKINKILYT